MPTGSSESPADTPDEPACCKLTRVAAQYGFYDQIDRFGDAWADPDGASLRALSRQFNDAVVHNALREAGEVPLDGEARNVRELLAADREASAGAVRRVENRLEKRGLDADALREDFVSYRTVDRHFKRCAGRERPTDPESAAPTTAGVNRIRRLRRRLEAVTEGTVRDLDAAGHVDQSDFDVEVDVRVVCGDCGTSAPVGTVIEEGCPACGGSP